MKTRLMMFVAGICLFFFFCLWGFQKTYLEEF